MVVGILGGGQLARMMLIQAHRLGIECHVLSSRKDDPAGQVTSFWSKGDVKSKKDILHFAQKVDILTFESEFAPPEVLEELKKLEKVKKVKCYPSAKNMLDYQDRFSQKKLLEKFEIPTSSFIKMTANQDVKSIKNNDFFNDGFVIKARRDGYDGKGTFIVKKKDLTDSKSLVRANSFIAKIPSGVIVEQFIAFQRELAISVVRSSTGRVEFLPLVQSHQEEYRCLWVKGPVDHSGLKTLKKKLKKLLNSQNYVGLITFELFDDGKHLYVNEVAPRVHNSAHYSQDCLSEDQFSLHLKAICGLEINSPKPLTGGFAMYNLIGSNHKAAKSASGFSVASEIKDECKLHWYGKKQNYIGRKMGHINVNSKNSDLALKKLKKLQKEITI